jgi:nucleotide-binding universal stress UspA family protein
MVRELERLRDWVGDVSLPVRARVLVHRGEAAAQVMEYAGKHDVDLIVLGAERKGRGSKSVLGSTTHRLTRHAPCPVLTVPAASFDRDLRAA